MSRVVSSIGIVAPVLFVLAALAGCRGASSHPNCLEPLGTAGIAAAPEVGVLVKLYIAGAGAPVLGRVSEPVGRVVYLDTYLGGKVVVDWSRVVAWEVGESLQYDVSALERSKQLLEYSAETEELIRRASLKMPGRDTE